MASRRRQVIKPRRYSRPAVLKLGGMLDSPRELLKPQDPGRISCLLNQKLWVGPRDIRALDNSPGDSNARPSLQITICPFTSIFLSNAPSNFLLEIFLFSFFLSGFRYVQYLVRDQKLC